jgi:hypothetical protein
MATNLGLNQALLEVVQAFCGLRIPSFELLFRGYLEHVQASAPACRSWPARFAVLGLGF